MTGGVHGLRHHEAAQRGGLWPRGVQWAIELGLLFVLCEGLLRRMFVSQAVYVLAFKFCYFPALYAALLLRPHPRVHIRWLPPGVVPFLAWGILVTLINLWRYPVTGLLGLGVNLCFVPLAYVGAAFYSTDQDRRGFFFRMTVLAGLLGLLALYQSTLGPGHWLNLDINEEGRGISMEEGVRVTSSFQFCNAFGQYAAFGILACAAAVYLARTSSEIACALVCGLLLYCGVVESGSRMGGLGSLVVLAACRLPAPAARKKVATLAAVGLVLGGAVLLIVHPSSDSGHQELRRGQDPTGLVERVTETYVGGRLWPPWRRLTTGWGPAGGPTRWGRPLTPFA